MNQPIRMVPWLHKPGFKLHVDKHSDRVFESKHEITVMTLYQLHEADNIFSELR